MILVGSSKFLRVCVRVFGEFVCEESCAMWNLLQLQKELDMHRELGYGVERRWAKSEDENSFSTLPPFQLMIRLNRFKKCLFVFVCFCFALVKLKNMSMCV